MYSNREGAYFLNVIYADAKYVLPCLRKNYILVVFVSVSGVMVF